MIKRILNSKIHVKDKVKNLIGYIKKSRGAKKSWNKRHAIVFDKHPEFKKTVNVAKEKLHREYWSDFSFNFRIDTFRICESISGDSDPKIIPEEIFQADIEPSLNNMLEAHYLGHKSLYNLWFPSVIFPKDFIHDIEGELIGGNYERILQCRMNELAEELPYPVILKPSLNSWGGKAIHIIENKEQLLSKMKGKQNFVVQEKIQQHEILHRLHPPSLNTVRVYLYKSVNDNKTHIVNIAQRMGNGGVLDNVTSGGLISLVQEDGSMHGFALDRYGQKFKIHPVTGLPFKQCLPEFEKMKNLAINVASKLYHLRVVGLDLCFDIKGTWRVIEINTKGHSIRFSQYPGWPFFGKFTDEVKDYCVKNHWALK